jgi:hypothetical protein
MLCGFPFFAPAGVAVALVPADGLRRPRVAAARSGVAAARLSAAALHVRVWLLMNRLIRGTPSFFCDRCMSWCRTRHFALAVLLPGALLLPALLMTWLCDAQRSETGAGPHAASVILISFALMLVGTTECGTFRPCLGFGHAARLFPCVADDRAGALRQPSTAWRHLALFVWLTTLWLATRPRLRGAAARTDLPGGGGARHRAHRVRPRLRARLRRARSVARLCRQRLVANMDLHVGSARRAYKGQNLYVLVPRPEGPARAESVFWKHPDIYRHGGDRLLFAGAFGTWHLFEIISAPTQKQLDEWKKAGGSSSDSTVVGGKQ